jgi:hypothetical protein
MKGVISVKRTVTATAILLFLLTLSACGPSYHTTNINGVKKVYHVNDQGQKNLVFEVGKDGTTTVYDENDPMYQQHLMAQQLAEADRQAKANRIERIKQSKKRSAKDPIYVVLHPTELDKALKKAEKHKGAVYDQIRQEFESDRIIRLITEKNGKKSSWSKLRKSFRKSKVDVEVNTRSYLKKMTGINKKTGKITEMTAIVFEATITSNYLPESYNVIEAGNIFRNPEVTQRFADKVKRVIKYQIGPGIPADRTI